MMLNKKGQGLPTSTLVLMIIAAVVLVFVIIGFTTGWGYIFDKIGLLPNDLTAAAQACEQYAGNDALKLSSCEFRELTIDGKKGYYNCAGIHKAATDAGVPPTWVKPECALKPETFCENKKLKGGVLVNGFECHVPVEKPAA